MSSSHTRIRQDKLIAVALYTSLLTAVAACRQHTSLSAVVLTVLGTVRALGLELMRPTKPVRNSCPGHLGGVISFQTDGLRREPIFDRQEAKDAKSCNEVGVLIDTASASLFAHRGTMGSAEASAPAAARAEVGRQRPKFH
jgi:hypothetical protein